MNRRIDRRASLRALALNARLAPEPVTGSCILAESALPRAGDPTPARWVERPTLRLDRAGKLAADRALKLSTRGNA
jgi:hypothetical protein